MAMQRTGEREILNPPGVRHRHALVVFEDSGEVQGDRFRLLGPLSCALVLLLLASLWAHAPVDHPIAAFTASYERPKACVYLEVAVSTVCPAIAARSAGSMPSARNREQ